jgi:hypothetical protein
MIIKTKKKKKLWNSKYQENQLINLYTEEYYTKVWKKCVILLYKIIIIQLFAVF